jgi:hypothetical protein
VFTKVFPVPDLSERTYVPFGAEFLMSKQQTLALGMALVVVNQSEFIS